MTTISAEDFLNEPGPQDHSQTEQRYGLPSGILADIRDKGERSGAKAVSPKGAQGRFQLMPEVQKAYGVTNPASESQSADAAGRLLRDTYAQYRKEYPGVSDEQIWDAVTAHYNGGYNAGRAVAQGKVPPAKETRDYLARISEVSPDEFLDQPTEVSAEDFLAGTEPEAKPIPGSTSSRFSVPAGSTLLARKNVPPKSQLERSPSGLFEPGSRSEAIAQGFSAGSTLGLGPLAAPYIRGILPGGVDSTLDERRLQQAQIQARAESQHPGATFAGSLLGGLPIAAATGGGGNTLLAKAWQAGRAGAIQGGVSGAAHEALDPNATAGDVLLGGGLGATLGGTIGAAVPAVGAGIKAGLNRATETKLGQSILGKYADVNPVTGQPIQANLSELVADKTGIGTLTAAGRERLMKSKLAEEYIHSAPTVRAKYFDVNEVGKEGGRGSGWKTGTVKRYDSEGKLIQDQLYREAGSISDGKVIFGEPVMDPAAVEMATGAPANPVYMRGKLVGYLDPTAVGSPWSATGEIQGPISEAYQKAAGRKVAEARGEPSTQGLSPERAKMLLGRPTGEAPAGGGEKTQMIRQEAEKAAASAMAADQKRVLRSAVQHVAGEGVVQGLISVAESQDALSEQTANMARAVALGIHSRTLAPALKAALLKNAPDLMKMYGLDLASKDPSVVSRALYNISAALKPTAQAAVRAAPTKTDADYQALLGQQLGFSSKLAR